MTGNWKLGFRFRHVPPPRSFIATVLNEIRQAVLDSDLCRCRQIDKQWLSGYSGLVKLKNVVQENPLRARSLSRTGLACCVLYVGLTFMYVLV